MQHWFVFIILEDAHNCSGWSSLRCLQRKGGLHVGYKLSVSQADSGTRFYSTGNALYVRLCLKVKVYWLQTLWKLVWFYLILLTHLLSVWNLCWKVRHASFHHTEEENRNACTCTPTHTHTHTRTHTDHLWKERGGCSWILEKLPLRPFFTCFSFTSMKNVEKRREEFTSTQEKRTKIFSSLTWVCCAETKHGKCTLNNLRCALILFYTGWYKQTKRLKLKKRNIDYQPHTVKWDV